MRKAEWWSWCSRRLALAFIAGAAMSSCAESDTTGLPGGDGGDLFCFADTDCPAPLSCQQGVCREPMVIDGECNPLGAICGEDSDPCCEGLECRVNVCQPPTDGHDGGDRKDHAVIEVDRTEIAFGAVQLGESKDVELRITNRGLAPLAVSEVRFDSDSRDGGELDFTLGFELRDPIETDAEVVLTVHYVPVDPGADEGELFIVSNDPNRSIVEIPLFSEVKGDRVAVAVSELEVAAAQAVADPDSVLELDGLDFGELPVGASVTRSVFLINLGSGNNTLTVRELRTAPISSDHFSLSADPAPAPDAPTFVRIFSPDAASQAGSSVRIDVTFAPAAPGEIAEALVISSDDPEAADLRLDLTGVGVVAQLLLEPEPVDFGGVFLGAEARLPVVVRNGGGNTLEISAVAPPAPPDTGDAPFTFEDLDTLTGSYAPGEERGFAITFTPQALGDIEAALTFTSDDPERGEHALALRGAGLSPPIACVDPGAVDFGLVQLEQSDTQIVSVCNRGESILEVLGISLRSEDEAPDDVEPPLIFDVRPRVLPGIAPEGDLGLNVSFSPPAVGAHSDTLLLRTNDPDQPLIEVPLQGEGSAPAICVEPLALDFGPSPIGIPQGPLPVLISNCGTGPLAIDAIRIDAGPAPAFTQTGVPTLPRFLADGETLLLQVGFTPRPGEHSGELVIEHGVIGEPEVRVALSGSGEGCPDGFVDLDDDPDICEYGCPVWPPEPETCDDVDNDCDGSADEDFGVGADCDGVGLCGDGTVECASATTTRCSTEPGGTRDQSREDICDGQDNDCDGDPDEDWGVGADCEGEGLCGAGVVECAGLRATRCSTEGGGSQDQSSDELCDGLDNDCDGDDDEDFGVGNVCTADGECGPGVIECQSLGETRCSSGPGGSGDRSGPEICDAADNDCDGSTDEDFGVGLDCDGEGACGPGVIQCATPNSARCSTEPGGTADESRAESCDHLDNDCDGSTDEDFALGTPCDGVGACGAGVFECNLELVRRVCSTDVDGSERQDTPEVCDGLDNDCDGSADEDFNVGNPCEGAGECGAGVIECLGLDNTVCSTEPGGSADQASAELCNALDDDCDGRSDEDYAIGAACDGTGECGVGVRECQDLLSWRCSTDPGGTVDQAEAESCDRLDNDCDGDTDEDFAIGELCDGVGTCGAGVFECNLTTGQRVCSTDSDGSQAEDVPEVCDGLDNDCDGLADEQFGIGQPCEGRGECGAGQVECAGLNATRCSTDASGSQSEAVAELCDGLDNDCDGRNDEDFGIGQPCDGRGECGAGVRECATPDAWRCSTEPGGTLEQAIPEICNGRDDDCDGLTDEDFAIGQPCDGVGACGAGVFECNLLQSRQVCSTDPDGSRSQAAPELCDGQDNDCDGDVDEDFGVGVACEGRGECGAGVIECFGVNATVCSTEPGGSQTESAPELCDALDNDCDGGTDEDFAVGEVCDGRGECGIGIRQCADLNSSRCSTEPGGTVDQSVPEICDGRDNDCDGLNDEDFTIGAACDGQGACGAGVFECNLALRQRVCSTDLNGSQSQVLPESCDGLDNDCDGSTDEDFNVGELCDGEGACGVGIRQCRGLAASVCSTEPGGDEDQSSTDLCDGLDNDCDGSTDEDFVIGAQCNGEGECGVGVRECAGLNDWRCSTEPGGSVDQSVPETCNGVDDDCDGLTDEDWNIGNPCDGIGGCGLGVFECTGPSSAQCSTDIGGSEHLGPNGGFEEACNGIDDDCDGLTDEKWDDLGDACGQGNCTGGVRECDDFGIATRCSTEDGGSNDQQDIESCDGEDDDCDGATDENYGVGSPCTPPGACGPGVIECFSLATAGCNTGPGGSLYPNPAPAELCNNIDDDCDGDTDEGINVGAPCDGEGACGVGVVECDGSGVPICSTDPGGSADQSIAEQCDDALDNDCDGDTDEGCASCPGDPFELGNTCATGTPLGVGPLAEPYTFDCLFGGPGWVNLTAAITVGDEDWYVLPVRYSCIIGGCSLLGGWNINVQLTNMPVGEDYNLMVMAGDCTPSNPWTGISQAAGNVNEQVFMTLPGGIQFCAFNLYIRIFNGDDPAPPSCGGYTLSLIAQ